MARYLIGTGFFNPPGGNKDQFFPIWYSNTIKYCKPERIIVLANGESKIVGAPGQWIELAGNLGHTHDLTNHIKPHHWCGWSWAFVTLAALAYFDECDFVFKEQDALAFGPWVEQMYAEIGERGMIFGRNKVWACSQSIVLCKHSFIPEFIRLYMSTGSEQDKANECELKFARLEHDNPKWFGRYCFGVDRNRPIPMDEPVFYAQQIDDNELQELKNRKLIE